MTGSSLICLSGIDGSGKTEQCEQLQQKLADSDKNVKYIWCGLKPHVSRPLFRLGEQLFYPDDGSEADEYSTKTTLLEDWKIRQIYKSVIIPDYLIYTSVMMRYCLQRYDIVISDRYIHDAAIDLSILLGDEESLLPRYKKYKSVVPTPETIILLDVTEETAFRRKNDIPSQEYLSKRRQMYCTLADKYAFKKVDGDQSIEAVNEKLIAQLKTVGIDARDSQK